MEAYIAQTVNPYRISDFKVSQAATLVLIDRVIRRTILGLPVRSVTGCFLISKHRGIVNPSDIYTPS